MNGLMLAAAMFGADLSNGGKPMPTPVRVEPLQPIATPTPPVAIRLQSGAPVCTGPNCQPQPARTGLFRRFR